MLICDTRYQMVRTWLMVLLLPLSLGSFCHEHLAHGTSSGSVLFFAELQRNKGLSSFQVQHHSLHTTRLLLVVDYV
ncbi:hypothetical protein V8C26DRAFT_385659 [Trichoderma gracile]